MEKKWRIFRLLMWKNYLIRRRHWKVILFLQILIPICLFLLLQKLRSLVWEKPKNHTYPIETKESFAESENLFLFYVPENDFTRKLMNYTIQCLSVPPKNLTGFPSEEVMLKNYSYGNGFNIDNKVLAIVFEETDYEHFVSKHLAYTLRSSYDTPDLSSSVLLDARYYHVEQLFFSFIPYVKTQMCIDESFINISAGNSISRQVTIQRMPTSGFVTLHAGDEFTRLIFSIIFIVVFVVTLCLESSFAANEKFTGVDILMALNGVPFYKNLCSWLVSGILHGSLYSIILTVVMSQAFGNPILLYGNPFITWVFLVIHIAHLITFGIHIASYFSKSSMMQIAIIFLYGGSSLFQVYLIDSHIYAIIPYLGIIFPNILLLRMLQEMNTYEIQGTGVEWSNMFRIAETSYTAAGSIGAMMILSIIGAVLHFILGIYIHTIFPGKFRTQEDPLYFLKNKIKIYKELEEELDEFSHTNEEKKPFEVVPKGLFTPRIQIRNLKQSYTTNGFVKQIHEVLHGISMDIYKGQITTVLGHNRAGKSTLMSILTGLLNPTEGVVLIDGKRIGDYLQTMSTNLNFCPQGNFFFSYLTVIEQMEFFRKLKCINRTEDEVEILPIQVKQLLKRLKLYEKKSSFPKQMSINQQRKLSLGLSLISNAEILILDEPTSGMDLDNRREIWDMLLEMKGEKTILISTHDTEEADILGDKVAILHLGKLKGYGTSVFLKKLYGEGNLEVTLSTTTWCNSEIIKQELGSASQLLKLEEETLVFCVPYTEQLAESLDRIENNKREFGVTGIKVSLITLEQVFLKVTKKEEDIDLTRPFVNTSHILDGRKLLLQSIFALLEKNFINSKKSICLLLSIIVLPLISILLMVLDFSSLNEIKSPRHLTLQLYNNPQVLFSSENETVSERVKMVIADSNGIAINIGPNRSLNNEIVQLAERDVSTYRDNLVSAIEFNISRKSFNANAFYSEVAFLSIPIGVNLISNVMIKELAGDEYEIDVSDHILPRLRFFSEMDLSAISLLFTCFLYPAVALYVIHPLMEISSGMKHLQTMSGVTPYIYWGTQFAFDFIIFFTSIILCLVAFYFMDHAVGLDLYHGSELAVMALLLILFAVNALPMVYIFSYMKVSKVTAVTILSLTPLMLLAVEGLFWIIELDMRYYIATNSYSTTLSIFLSFRKVQKKVFRLIPHMSFFHGQVSFLNTGLENAQCRYLSRHHIANHLLDEFCEDLLCFDGVCHNSTPYFGQGEKLYNYGIDLEESVIYMSLTPFMYFALLAAIEYGLLQKVFARLLNKKSIGSNEEVDDQVREEKYSVGFEINKIKSDKASNKANKLVTTTRAEGDNVLLVYDLSKCYKGKSIIKNLSFSVKSGECFGLLGVSASGKSTTFRILTGVEVPDKGDIFLKEKDIFTEKGEYLSQIGYCPQDTCLIDKLSARDHLRLFARIRGVPSSQIDSEVEEWISRLHLKECASEPTETYSLGNKRCLNIAIAFIGNPDLVLLDEPTTGVHPASRRSLWNLIKSFLKAGQSVILSSHSMEECETLCNRLAIMTKGSLVCIGSSEELKRRFGAGYNINIELNLERTDAQVAAIKTDIENALNCKIQIQHLGYIKYYVTNSKTPWKTMYEVMKQLKYKYSCIVDFTITSATLEQLFLHFARTDDQ